MPRQTIEAGVWFTMLRSMILVSELNKNKNLTTEVIFRCADRFSKMTNLKKLRHIIELWKSYTAVNRCAPWSTWKYWRRCSVLLHMQMQYIKRCSASGTHCRQRSDVCERKHFAFVSQMSWTELWRKGIASDVSQRTFLEDTLWKLQWRMCVK